MPSHLTAVLQALLVTFLWSTSWVLIKIGLADLPPLIFAALRYLLASVLLLAALLRTRTGRRELASLDRRSWLWLGALGLAMYTLTQGAQFIALGELPAIIVNLALSSTPVFVALFSIGLLSESPSRPQWLGMLIVLLGVVVYFDFAWPREAYLFGIGVALLGTVANGSAALLGRFVNRSGRLRPLLVTAVSMTIGSLALLAAGVTIEGLPALDAGSWAIVIWLAVVNTAFAFTLWNHTLRRLTATESSVLNNTMLIQIPILAWIFLGEALTPQQTGAVLIVAVGVLMVQLGRRALNPAGAPAADPRKPPEPD